MKEKNSTVCFYKKGPMDGQYIDTYHQFDEKHLCHTSDLPDEIKLTDGKYLLSSRKVSNHPVYIWFPNKKWGAWCSPKSAGPKQRRS